MITAFTDADVPDQSGKTFFITGANTGLGFEAARVLAGKGARVLIGCRNRTKAQAAREQILADHPKAEVAIVDLDLTDLASVRAAAETVGREPRLDGLINNAGIMMPPRSLTMDGFESQMGANHLGHFALTGLLLPLLEATAGSRIVTTSSNAHKAGDIDFDDLAAEKHYSSLGRYNASKLANLLHMYELDRRLKAKGSTTIAACAHPGGSTTELFRQFPRPLVTVFRPLAGLILNSALQGAWPTLCAATHPEVNGGEYFGPSGIGELAGKAREVTSTQIARDPGRAKRLWDMSVELTGVDPGLAPA